MAEREGADIAVITVCSRNRARHLGRQHEALRRWAPDVRRIVVMIGDETWDVPGAGVIDRTGDGPVRLGSARNAGAAAALRAGAGLLVFLDADCVPAPDLIDRYAAAVAADPGAVLCGPVTYLAEGTGDLDVGKLPPLVNPHPARPAPPPGTLERAGADGHDLFWSLSFAVTADLWRRIDGLFGGFHHGYAGYGAEDTDFGVQLAAHDVPMTWVGGAHALHQWHPVSSPPVEHLDDILRNGRLFRDRHGRWPMLGWLRAFAEMGLVRREGGDWVKA